MRRWLRRHRHVLAILGVAALLRLTLLPHVGVNDDTGLYLYDAMQITWGRHMFVDFPSRSPVFLYLLTGPASLPSHLRLVGARLLMQAISLGAGVAVYAFARQVVADRRVALAAMALYLLTPFTLMWNSWVKTESVAALFVLLALAVAFKYLDAERVPVAAGAAIGGLFALAVMTRRIAALHALLLAGFWLAYRWRRTDRGWRGAAPAMAAVLAVGTAGLAAIALWTVGGRVDAVWPLLDASVFGLLRSGGASAFGYWPVYGEAVDPVRVTVQKFPPPGAVASALGCEYEACGRTWNIYARAAFTSLPAVLALLVYLRSALRTAPWALRAFVPAALVAEFAFMAVLAHAVRPDMVVPMAVLAAAVAVVWRLRAPKWSELVNARLGYAFVTLAALSLGYSYRPRVLFVTYYQDLFPFVAVLAGVGAVAVWDGYREVAVEWRRVARVTLALLVALAWFSALLWTAPYPLSYGQSNYYTFGTVNEFGHDMDARLHPDKRVLTAQPLFIITSDHRLAGDLSRSLYLYERYPDSAATERLTDRLIREMESGEVPIAVVDHDLRTRVLPEHPRLYAAFNETFCEAAGDSLYERVNATLYVKPSTGTCVDGTAA